MVWTAVSGFLIAKHQNCKHRLFITYYAQLFVINYCNKIQIVDSRYNYLPEYDFYFTFKKP